MATMYVSYLGGAQFGVTKAPLGTVTITTSGVTAKTAAAAPAGAAIAVIRSDVAHYVATGAHDTVTAAAANGLYVAANETRELVLNPGDGVAAITV